MASPKRTRRIAFIAFGVLVLLAIIYTWFNMRSTDAAEDEVDMPMEEDPSAWLTPRRRSASCGPD